MFQIASISKSISATVASIEVTKGVVAWDDPVAKHLSGFKLNNDYVSEHGTIGDFFAHRSGLPGTAGDDLEDLGFKRNDVIARLQHLPLDPFRTSYHYANFSTTIGAEAVAAAAHEPWDKLADEQLLQPLGMKSTSYRHADYVANDNRAALHVYQNGRFLPLGQRNADEQAPAGGVSSTVVDLAEWVKLLLANGEYKGKRLIAEEALLPALSPQSFSARAHDTSARSGFYGYGFNVNTELGGRPSMGHSGAFLLGAGTAFKIVPSADIGIIVLTNGAPVGAAESVVAQFTDIALYGKASRDWFAAYNGAMKGFFQPQGDLSFKEKPAAPLPSKALQEYTGSFDNAYFGKTEVKEVNGTLTLVLGRSKCSSRCNIGTATLSPSSRSEKPNLLVRSHPSSSKSIKVRYRVLTSISIMTAAPAIGPGFRVRNCPLGWRSSASPTILPFISQHALSGIIAARFRKFESKAAPSDKPLSHSISAEMLARPVSRETEAPFTTKLAPGSSTKEAEVMRSLLKFLTHATLPRRVKTPSPSAKDLSALKPSSLRPTVSCRDA